MLERRFSILSVPVTFSKLHLAASKGDLGTVGALLKGGSNVNLVTSELISPLHLASQHGHLQVVKLLITSGANLNQRTDEGFTPLHLALQQSQLEVSEFLIQVKADVNACDNENWTPLHNACSNRFSLAIVKALLKEGANVNAKNKDSETALHLASASDDVEIVNCLIQNGAEVNAVDKGNRTPLHRPTYDGHLEVTELLLKNGADVNRRGDENGWRLLHYAIEAQNIKTVELLLNYGADVNSADDKNGSPLHVAVTYIEASVSYFNIAILLLERGADVNAKVHKDAEHHIDHLGKTWTPPPGRLLPVCFPLATPLHLAAMGGNFEMIKALLDKGAYYNARAPAGEYSLPIEFAMIKGYPKAIKLMELVHKLFEAVYYKTDMKQLEICIQEGAPLNARDIAGRSPLYYACTDSLAAVKLLLKNNADIFQTTNEGVPALYMAANQNNDEMVDDLLRHAVKELKPIKMFQFVNARRKGDDSTSLHFAVQNENLIIVKLLLEYGAIYDLVPASSSQKIQNIFQSVTDLFKATKTGDEKKVATILQKEKAIINARDFEGGATLLFWAVQNDHLGIVQFLLDNGADPIFVTKKGNTPLHIASLKGNNRAVQLLLNHVKSDSAKLDLFINAQTTVGRMSALHIASTVDVAKSLLQYGAIYNFKNKDGKTPFDLTKCDVKSLLELTDKLFKGTRNGDTTVIEQVNKLEWDVFTAVTNARNEEDKHTALQVTVTNGLKYQKIAKELSELMKRSK